MNRVSVSIEMDLPDGVRVRGYERFDDAHSFQVEWDLPERVGCSKCGREAPVAIHDKEKSPSIRDLDLLGLPSYFVYLPPIHVCPHCSHRTQLPAPFKRPRVTYTHRFEEMVLEMLVGSATEDVARRLGISSETVWNIVEHRLAEHREVAPDRLISSIGLDELSLKKRHKLYVTVMTDLSDPTHPRVLAVAKGRDKAATNACLDRLTETQRQRVRTHRTDMSAVYPDVCAERLPNSKLVVDRFHVAMHLGKLVDRQRQKKTREYKRRLSRAEVKQFRSRMWTFRRRRKDLTAKDQADLEQLFTAVPELEFPYCVREDVAEIFDTAFDRDEASERFEQLRACVAEARSPLSKFFEFYDRWREGILAYFDNYQTSGPVEGINTKARVITRRSYGLKSADSLWNRLILDVNRVVGAVHRTVQEMHQIARTVKAAFTAAYI